MVLLFPPVNNFRRFLIHQTCENFRNKYDLFTFSVGQGPFRRTVICFRSQLLDPHKYFDSAAATNFEIRHKSSNISTLKNWRSDNRRVESFNNSNNLNKCDTKMGVEQNIIDTNKLNKQNLGVLYRPPALRSQIHEIIKKNTAENKKIDSIESSTDTLTNTLQSHSSSPTLSIKATTSISCSNSPIHRNENVNINNVTTSTQQTTNKTQQLYTLNKQEKQQRRQQPQQQERRERRPDRAVYIPRARRSQTTPPNTTTSQIQPLPQHEALSTQLHAIAPTQSTNASKCLSQQLAITSDGKAAALVKQKPLTKADEVSKAIINGVNTHDNIRASNTIIKKKDKLSKENKELREQRREQRLLKKLNSEQIVNISETYKKHNIHVDSLSAKLNSDDVPEDHSINQKDFINAPQIYSSSETNNVNHLSELNNYFNVSKVFNCDTCEQLKENELLDSNAKNISFLKVIKQESDESANTDISVLNDFEISQCINSPILYHRSNTSCDTTTNDIIATNIVILNNNNNNNNTMPKPSNKTKSNKINSMLYNTTKMPNLRIDDIQPPTKCDIEEQELQRASMEINRSNRRIIKQTFVSDVLQIPDHINEEESSKGKSKVEINNKRTSLFDSTTEEEEEEDDWESMYNESGDCLDPKIMQELTASVGKCKIELPKMDYSAYLSKQSILNEEEFPHVLEVSNFPVEFKNQDLLMVFSQYKESGFDIKWVDDTHALAVFSSSRIAAEVLTMGHPFVVLKPLAEATLESRLKAKKCAASLQPYRPRPETCAALARRLVTGALGVRLKTAAAERENEKRVLREAKERKLLAAKQRDEVWES